MMQFGVSNMMASPTIGSMFSPPTSVLRERKNANVAKKPANPKPAIVEVGEADDLFSPPAKASESSPSDVYTPLLPTATTPAWLTRAASEVRLDAESEELWAQWESTSDLTGASKVKYIATPESTPISSPESAESTPVSPEAEAATDEAWDFWESQDSQASQASPVNELSMVAVQPVRTPVSYTHLTLPTICSV